eukprot:Lithocolla_globosa_v1_NODE_6506_length_1076_cov_5.807052.p1 type:complete len:318 gc:universal NODE_6506_length_1076_cov_5.807052:99-1052(+)
MEMEEELNTAVYDLIKKDDENICEALKELVAKYGKDTVLNWRSSSKHKHSLLFEMTVRCKLKALRCLVKEYGMDINSQRPSDKCTPLHLSGWYKNPQMIDLLLELGADDKILNGYGEDASKTLETRKTMENFVWMDLEMTSLEDPDILECCIIITDKNLQEKVRQTWVIYYPKEKLDSLSEWHQTQFKTVQEGGNDLFFDCINSKITTQQFENELLDFLKKNCVEKHSHLSGSSIHCDREVLRIKHRKIYDFFSHQIIDVSTISGLMERWSPQLRQPLQDTLYKKEEGQKTRQHRAMDDITRSIEMLKFYKENFFRV